MAGRARAFDWPRPHFNTRERIKRFARKCADLYEHRHDEKTGRQPRNDPISKDWNVVPIAHETPQRESLPSASGSLEDTASEDGGLYADDIRGSVEILVLQALRAGFQSVDPELLQRLARHSQSATAHNGANNHKRRSGLPALQTALQSPTDPPPVAEPSPFGEVWTTMEGAIVDTLRSAPPQLVQELVGPPALDERGRDLEHMRSYSAPSVSLSRSLPQLFGDLAHEVRAADKYAYNATPQRTAKEDAAYDDAQQRRVSSASAPESSRPRADVRPADEARHRQEDPGVDRQTAIRGLARDLAHVFLHELLEQARTLRTEPRMPEAGVA